MTERPDRLQEIKRFRYERQQAFFVNLLTVEEGDWLIAEVERLRDDLARLKAELAAKRLRWQRGPVPEDGCYVFEGESRLEMNFFQKGYSPKLIKGRWAGPIEPPSSEES